MFILVSCELQAVSSRERAIGKWVKPLLSPILQKWPGIPTYKFLEVCLIFLCKSVLLEMCIFIIYIEFYIDDIYKLYI